MKQCKHIDENGQSTLIDNLKWFGVSIPRKQCICKTCKQILEIDKEVLKPLK